MLVLDGYSVEQYPYGNKIVIHLPQTMETISGTTGLVADRKVRLTDAELAKVLFLVMALYRKEGAK